MSGTAPKGQRTIVILGLPNTGKSQLFGRLTGAYSLTANYPRTTIEEKRVTCRINQESFEVIDTPELHCLYIHSEEELVVRDLLYRERPDILIQVINATQLKQSLTLTSDLLDLGIPLVVCLNVMDEAKKKGMRISSRSLEEKLGVPVVETIATEGSGIRELRQALGRARPGNCFGRYGETVEKSISDLALALDKTVPYPRKTAALLLLGDPFIRDFVMAGTPDHARDLLDSRILAERRNMDGKITHDFLDLRNSWVDEIAAAVLRKSAPVEHSFAERFAHLSRHPVYGIPILILFLALVFFMVVYVAEFVESGFQIFVANPVIGLVSKLLPAGFWHDFLVGQYGLVTLGIFNALGTVLPILATFFLVLSFFEDIGYITNLCVLTRRVFSKLGLSGKSITSLILSFGCKTVATLSTRGLTSFKEKFIANFLIAFAIPCGTKLALLIAVLGRIGLIAFVITFGALILCFFGVGLVLNKILKEDAVTDFIQELPTARLPNLRALLVKAGYRIAWFLKESIPIYILAAAAIFVLDRTGVLNGVATVFAPVAVGWLGLPRDVVDVLLLCFAQNGAGAGHLLKTRVISGLYTPNQIIVSAVLVTTFIPCVAHLGVLRKEMGAKAAAVMIVCIMLSALVLSGIVHHVVAFLLGGR